jgi:hypothetical protein
VPITAKKLSAVYNTSSHTLTLTAWGENQENIYGIEFTKQGWKEEHIIQFELGG